MKILPLLIYTFLFCSICSAQSDSIYTSRNTSDTLLYSGKLKLSIGGGLVVTKQNGNFPIYSAELFRTFSDNMALGGGIDFYKFRNEANKYTLSLNGYFLFNPYFSIKKRKFAELYFGPGLEISFNALQALALFRVDFDINEKISAGISLKQPLFYNEDESLLTYHIFKINFSYNF